MRARAHAWVKENQRVTTLEKSPPPTHHHHAADRSIARGGVRATSTPSVSRAFVFETARGDARESVTRV